MNFKLNTPLIEAFDELDKINSTNLDESAQSDELTKLDAEIADLETEIKDLKIKYETAGSKYRDELESTEEYKTLEAKYKELQSELWRLTWSYRRYDRNDPDGGDWEFDEEQYEKVKDRIAEIEQLWKEMRDDYWAPW